MKNLYKTLLFSATMLAGNTAFGQTTDFYVYDSDSLSGCINSIQLSLNIGNNPETGGVITVNWGDGSTGTANYTTASGANYHWEELTHGYSVAGLYTATVSVYSATAGANVGSAQTIQLLANDPANCGVVSLHTYGDDPTVPAYFPDVPYDFEGNDGTITTITPSSNFGDDYSGLNLANLPYTVTINQQWLTDHGLEVVSPTAGHILTSFDANGLGDINHAFTNVTCSPTSNVGPDFTFYYAHGIFVAPLQQGNVNMQIANLTCSGTTSGGTVSLTFDPAITPVTTGLINPVITGNVLSFDFTCPDYVVGVPLQFTFPGATPAGTEFEFTATITNSTETNTSNNTLTFIATVVNSYDPNNKLVNKGAIIDPNAQEVLQYTINFQNEGNYPALDVVVTDPISENLDLSTFRLLDSKHGVAASVNEATRVVTFSFNNIMLAPKTTSEEGSKGYVVYSIKENAGLPLNSEIENTAYIYFDFNPAVVTNTTKNTNAVLSVNETALENISMYPNPANTSLRFNGAVVKSVKIVDLSGKIVLSETTVKGNEISVASLANGIYQIAIVTETGVQTQKLLIRK